MKHNLPLIAILTLMFFLSHIIGLFVISHYLPAETQLPLAIQKPQLNEKTSYLPVFIAILLASAIILILLKLKAFSVWRFWFLLSAFLTLAVAFASFLPELIAVALAIILSLLKIYRPNIYIHNLTELFIYGGLVAIFVPMFSVKSAIILLILISIYDMIAVWKTKHMIKMAEAQKKLRVFAGMSIPYREKPIGRVIKTAKKVKQKFTAAILGGGDIGFPLLFSGAVLKSYGFSHAIIVSAAAAVSLFLLFLFAKRKKYYPAMPFLSIGCFIGLLISYLF